VIENPVTTSDPALKAPFPYFGGKSSIARKVWKRFGNVHNYVEPFFGSGAVLLGRPKPFVGTETVNDADGFVSNFWRALQADPEKVAHYADWPVIENDLHARHIWLVEKKEGMQAQLEGDPEWYDPKIAGWWVWGMACWIGGEFCSGKGPWQTVIQEDGSRQLVHLGNAGQGVNRRRVHLGRGRGVNRQRVHLGNAGQGVNRRGVALLEYFEQLADRLRSVRVCCGDWQRVCGPTPTVKQGLTAIFLDPPYADTAGREPMIYRQDSATVAHDVRQWAIDHGDDSGLRIALCGYEGEHEMPAEWECLKWKAQGGMANQTERHDNPNARRERVWFSPHCLKPKKHAIQLMMTFSTNGDG
jgi:site-specific DNA-adenine methylase